MQLPPGQRSHAATRGNIRTTMQAARLRSVVAPQGVPQDKEGVWDNCASFTEATA
jgi:hypothetical protein